MENFKSYINLAEQGYLSGLDRELSIGAEHLKGNSYVASNVKIGDKLMNKIHFTIEDFQKSGEEVTHVTIKISPDKSLNTRTYSKDDDGTQLASSMGGQRITLNIDQFNQLMSQGLNQPQSPMGM